MNKRGLLHGFALCAMMIAAPIARSGETIDIWPGKPPGEIAELPPEADIYKPTDDKIAGRPIIKLSNVSKPLIEVYRPVGEVNSQTAVVICPGGGHYILAYDLEGTEVAEWLNSMGVTGIVLKYRVPAREKDPRWRAAVQDAQRAVSLVRSRAAEWDVDPQRIGICGFSAGGETAGLTAIFEDERTYEPVDEVDQASCRPNFAMLIYPAGFADENGLLRDHVRVKKSTPPMFLVHAHDDPVSPLHSVALYGALKQAGVSAELHIYSAGGHGYGLRRTELPVTKWPARCSEWMSAAGWLDQPEE